MSLEFMLLGALDTFEWMPGFNDENKPKWNKLCITSTTYYFEWCIRNYTSKKYVVIF